MTPKLAETPEAKGFVVIHGHFYQPPRENPWIEQIEVEAGAQPYHDWNARINAECYRPNAWARVYDGVRRILDIINNYEYLSFNFGPTLMRWLEDKAPQTYERILEADRKSLARLGHGNAIAQTYTHVILPLARPRDRETDVVWGLKDFEHRFKRPAEAIWLPETAVNYPTLETLADQGLKFIILSPHQANRVRPLKGGEWQPVQAHTIDTTQAYRCFLPQAAASKGGRRFLDIFFYNGAAAADISFGDLLTDSYRLAGRLGETYSPEKLRPQILHVATDGETYGHHRKWGELALAHALAKTLPDKGFTLANYAAFLEIAPPRMEVELYLGPKGEGSSWSCAHGVGRWKEDCGCSTGGQPLWNQRWRSPLRQALDFLNGKLAHIFEAEGSKYLADPWAARNDYVAVILDRSPESVARFFSRQGAPGLKEEAWVPALKLLEMQRHALLMYTSCGWFFADLAGLETLQVMKYAARALELGQEFTLETLEEPFLERLGMGVSNIPAEGTGRDVYLRRVKPAAAGFPRVLSQWAISWLQQRHRQCPCNFYHFRIEPQNCEEKTQGSLALGGGRARITSGVTWESKILGVFCLFLGGFLYRTQVVDPPPPEFEALKREIFQALASTPEDLIPLMARRLGDRYYTVHDMFREEKQVIFQELLQSAGEEAETLSSHVFEESRPLLKAMTKENLPLPRLFRLAGEIALSRRLVQLLKDLEPDPTDAAVQDDLLELVEETVQLGLELDAAEAEPIIRGLLNRHVKDLAAGFKVENAARLQKLLELLGRIPINADLTRAQNMMFALMEQRFPAVAAKVASDPKSRTLAKVLVEVMTDLYFNPTRYLRQLS